jgi:putative tryptophan/tyrosine transport system substrate-binding protein
MRRRDFIALLGGAVAAAWPLAARAQQGERIRRIGFLTWFADSDAEALTRVKVFQDMLQQLGWMDGSNIHIDYRFAAGAADVRRFAKELVQLAPDVIVVQSTPGVRVLQQETSTIPIVFVQVTDPVRAGFVASMARPGGNMTGLSMYEPAMGAKWIELLKEIAPSIKRVALLFNPETAPGGGSFFLRSIEAAAKSLAVEPVPISVHDAAGIEHGIDAFANGSSGGLFVMPDLTTQFHHKLIVALANRHRIPAIYSQLTFVTSGGLIAYGIDTVPQFRQAAEYVDRILRGAKPGELPVQGPVKFELAINLKTAKTLGLTVPDKLLVAADEVIE